MTYPNSISQNNVRSLEAAKLLEIKCSNWAIKEMSFDYVVFSKAGSETTIDTKFDKRTVSYICKLVDINKKTK